MCLKMSNFKHKNDLSGVNHNFGSFTFVINADFSEHFNTRRTLKKKQDQKMLVLSFFLVEKSNVVKA